MLVGWLSADWFSGCLALDCIDAAKGKSVQVNKSWVLCL